MVAVWIGTATVLQGSIVYGQPKVLVTPLAWGITAYNQGNDDLALRYFKQAWLPQSQLVGLKPVDPTPLVWQAKCYARLGDDQHAAQAINDATALAQPGSQAYRLATQTLQQLFLSTGAEESTTPKGFRQVLGGNSLPVGLTPASPSTSAPVRLWQKPIVVWVQPKMPAFLSLKQAQRLQVSSLEVENLLRQWQPAFPSSVSIELTDQETLAAIKIYWVEVIETSLPNTAPFNSGLTQWQVDNNQLTGATVRIAVKGPSGQARTKVALLQTTLHELGHALGLAQHSLQPGDIMAAHGVGSYHVSPNDLTRLQALYSPAMSATLTVLP